jgi:lipoprotein-anchoring transpeptidase ErfK/SrfK
MKSRVVALAVAVLFALGVGTSHAQSTPVPTPTPTPAPSVTIPNLPSTTQIINDVLQTIAGQATGAFGYNANEVHGTVTYFKRFDMQVALQLNKYRQVKLHQGTVINPRGATLAQGQNVDVWGHSDQDGTLEADTITIH